MNKPKHKISFDFDDTLSNVTVQRYAYMFVNAGHDVHIVTSRMSNERSGSPTWNDDLYVVAKSVGIDTENIHFCNLKPKDVFFKDNEDFLFHLDDDSDDVDVINRNTSVTGILFVDTHNNMVMKEIIKLIDGE